MNYFFEKILNLISGCCGLPFTLILVIVSSIDHFDKDHSYVLKPKTHYTMKSSPRGIIQHFLNYKTNPGLSDTQTYSHFQELMQKFQLHTLPEKFSQ